MAAKSQSLYKQMLIIDDDVEDQEIFMEALREVDSSVICYAAVNGEEAFRQLESNVVMLPDLIFLDMNMPKLNGKQVLKEIKSNRSYSRIPVIMYSTSFSPRDIEEISKLGAVHHLFKPSRFEELCNALRNTLSQDWSDR